MDWKDCSSYGRGEKNREPKDLRCSAGGVAICIHKHIHYPKDQWLLSCAPFFDKYELQPKGIEECKALALDLVRVKLLGAAEAFTK
jgi:hypothetical protein